MGLNYGRQGPERVGNGTGYATVDFSSISLVVSDKEKAAAAEVWRIMNASITSACDTIRNASWSELVARDERRNGSLPTMDQILKPREN